MSANLTFVAKFLRGGIVAALLALGACGDGDRTPIVSDASGGQALSLTATGGRGTSSDYRLGPNDRTRIIVFGQPTLTGEFQLDGNGVLAYPLIGNVDARGMTPSELQQTIAQRLDKDWVHNPSVSVEVSTRRPFYVIGEVQKPGSYPYVTDMSVLNAIATAGGQTYRANMADFYIKRKQDGRVVRVQATQESLLQPGDTVVVKERYF
ncbi:MAG: polysaccharide export protein [Reyranella sp.]|uniref:polysaccharide biosynthesis/export family protein n=1 Tax=Reyranella sp. TaxID=1929291 RepID=UPI001AC376D6|nr:polysaccharide biosynthesis/export family protein [Reyranella sp.]MBN9088381.1 polysaccharide export protein [Reyranella sp.]